YCETPAHRAGGGAAGERETGQTASLHGGRPSQIAGGGDQPHPGPWLLPVPAGQAPQIDGQNFPVGPSGAQQRPSHFAGFKFGIDPWETSAWRHRFEWGVDSHLAPGGPGPAVLQFKYTTQPRSGWPALILGVANVASTSFVKRSRRSRY